MLKHLESGSAIINTTSVTAYQGAPQLLDYSATKGAIVAFTRSLSQGLVEQGIRVNGVTPGPIWTPLILILPHFRGITEYETLTMGISVSILPDRHRNRDPYAVPLVELPITGLPSVPLEQYCNLFESGLQYFCLLKKEPMHLQEPGRIALLPVSFFRSLASQARLSLFFSPRKSPSLFP